MKGAIFWLAGTYSKINWIAEVKECVIFLEMAETHNREKCMLNIQARTTHCRSQIHSSLYPFIQSWIVTRKWISNIIQTIIEHMVVNISLKICTNQLRQIKRSKIKTNSNYLKSHAKGRIQDYFLRKWFQIRWVLHAWLQNWTIMNLSRWEGGCRLISRIR